MSLQKCHLASGVSWLRRQAVTQQTQFTLPRLLGWVTRLETAVLATALIKPAFHFEALAQQPSAPDQLVLEPTEYAALALTHHEKLSFHIDCYAGVEEPPLPKVLFSVRHLGNCEVHQ